MRLVVQSIIQSILTDETGWKVAHDQISSVKGQCFLLPSLRPGTGAYREKAGKHMFSFMERRAIRKAIIDRQLMLLAGWKLSEGRDPNKIGRLSLSGEGCGGGN